MFDAFGKGLVCHLGGLGWNGCIQGIVAADKSALVVGDHDIHGIPAVFAGAKNRTIRLLFLVFCKDGSFCEKRMIQRGLELTKACILVVGQIIFHLMVI